MNTKYTIKTTPTYEDLAIVKQWLYDEYLSNNQQFGFYCNWDLIEKGNNSKNVFICSYMNTPVGIILWRKDEKIVNIDIFVIKKSLRGKGLGSIFIDKFINIFKKTDALILELFCKPKKSVTFWRDKLNFIQFPTLWHSDENFSMFKPLIDFTLNKIEHFNIPENRLELWNVEPYQTDKLPPMWVWEINSDLAKKPIIFPCNDNWNIRLVIDNKINKEDKVKYFDEKTYSRMLGIFLYIDNQILD